MSSPRTPRRRPNGEAGAAISVLVVGMATIVLCILGLVVDGGRALQAADRAEAIRSRLDVAADSYAAGEIDGRQLARITGRLRPELERAEQLARAASTAPDLIDLASPDIAKRWLSLPLARKRAVIDLLLDISVLPARKVGGHNAFDPESVRIKWKTAG